MKIVIEGELTALNEYIRAERSHRSIASTIKRDETNRVSFEAMACKARPCPLKWYPVNLEITWYSKDQRKDIDNVAFAKKFIFDGLVEAGVLMSDGRKHISGYREEFLIDAERPRVEVVIHKRSSSD